MSTEVLYNITQAAEFLGITREHVRYLLNKKRIPTPKYKIVVGGRKMRLWTKDELMDASRVIPKCLREGVPGANK